MKWLSVSIDNLGQGSSLGGDQVGSGNSSMSLINLEIQLVMAELQLIEAQLQQMQGQQGQPGQAGQGAGAPGSGAGSGSTAPSAGSGTPQAASNEGYYDLASGASVGDPHLSFQGGQTAGDPSGKADNMQSQSDLVDANKSFFGGFQVSTQTTAPDSRGITYNQSATVATGDNRDTVTMGQGGAVTVLDDGKAVDLQKGQSVTLSSGAHVKENEDGSVTVSDANHHGGKISTTLSWNGKGVDAHFDASNAYLGGTLVGLAANSQTGVVG